MFLLFLKISDLKMFFIKNKREVFRMFEHKRIYFHLKRFVDNILIHNNNSPNLHNYVLFFFQ